MFLTTDPMRKENLFSGNSVPCIKFCSLWLSTISSRPNPGICSPFIWQRRRNLNTACSNPIASSRLLGWDSSLFFLIGYLTGAFVELWTPSEALPQILGLSLFGKMRGRTSLSKSTFWYSSTLNMNSGIKDTLPSCYFPGHCSREDQFLNGFF